MPKRRKGRSTRIDVYGGRKTKIVYNGRKVVGRIPIKTSGQGFTKTKRKRKKK